MVVELSVNIPEQKEGGRIAGVSPVLCPALLSASSQLQELSGDAPLDRKWSDNCGEDSQGGLCDAASIGHHPKRGCVVR